MQDDSLIERISQKDEFRKDGENCLLERASTVAQRVLEEIEALAGTTACKSVQLVRLHKWADFFFIDTIIYSSDNEGLQKYHSLSPRFS